MPIPIVDLEKLVWRLAVLSREDALALVGRSHVADAGIAHRVGLVVVAQIRLHTAKHRRLQALPSLKGLVYKGSQLQTLHASDASERFCKGRAIL